MAAPVPLLLAFDFFHPETKAKNKNQNQANVEKRIAGPHDASPTFRFIWQRFKSADRGKL